MFVWSSSICSVVIVNVLVIFSHFLPPESPHSIQNCGHKLKYLSVYYMSHPTPPSASQVQLRTRLLWPKRRTMCKVILHISRAVYYWVLLPIVRISLTFNRRISLCERLILCTSHSYSGMNTDGAFPIRCDLCKRFRIFRAFEVRNMSDIPTLRLENALIL